MAKSTILVTGANGQLGRELQQLSSQYPLFDFVFLSRIELSLEDPAAILSAFATHQPDFCINCAAYTAVDKAESEKELAFQVNGTAPGMLAKTCLEYGCKFIHVSTD